MVEEALIRSTAWPSSDNDQCKVAGNLPNHGKNIVVNLIDFLYFCRTCSTLLLPLKRNDWRINKNNPAGICHPSPNILDRHFGDPGLSNKSIGWFLLRKLGAVITISGLQVLKIQLFQIVWLVHVSRSPLFLPNTWGWVDISIHFWDVEKQGWVLNYSQVQI